MSADLVAFLAARLSEDEAVASRSVSEHSVMGDDQSSGLYYDYWERQDLDLGITAARVLRQVEAGRAILHEFETFTAATENMEPTNFEALSTKLAGIGIKQGFVRALGHLAAIYRDHEDYCEEWAL